MAIQPQIAMGFQMPQFQLPNQGNMLMQVAQLQQMQEANALRQAQARKLQLDEEQENALARLMQSGGEGVTLPQFVGAGGFTRGTRAFELSQAQRGAQQKETAGRQLTTAQTLAALRGDLSDEALGYASQMLAQQGQRDPFIAELMLTPREDRQLLASRLMNAVPGMEAARLATQKAEAELGKTQAEIAKLGAETRGVGAVKPTSDIQNYRQAVEQGFTGSFFDYQTQLKKAGRTEVKVNTGENVEEGARRKSLVEEETRARTAAQAARKALVSVDSAERVLEAGFKTGFGTDVKASAAAFLGALGVKDAEKFASQAQTFLKAAMDQVLARQLEQRGIQTNQDAQRMEQTFAQLGNTPEANRFVLALSRAQSNLAVEQDQFYRKWVKDNDTMKGAEDAWFEKQGDKSIFERPELKQYAPKKETPATAGGPVRLPKDNADEVYNSLPSGTVYIDPNGVQKRKR
jgi:hypothetical protein